MRRAANDTLSLLLHATTVIVVALSLTACKDKVPSDPRSPPKPRMESGTARASTVALHAAQCTRSYRLQRVRGQAGCDAR